MNSNSGGRSTTIDIATFESCPFSRRLHCMPLKNGMRHTVKSTCVGVTLHLGDPISLLLQTPSRRCKRPLAAANAQSTLQTPSRRYKRPVDATNAT
ncbi:hypothetical protein POVWA1_008110 [Plasmodium ovale wallikeri]|uniref:Uncharacterized protein n=1 Tax=Plasmodium ovale wallikeri TaxID=864142 RepID=A0A1A8YJB5_PLAOA|nr:hypothetical protein POVWA1_008110 [Plasmodium ovale wallikeri]